jgi:hypothetical protein
MASRLVRALMAAAVDVPQSYVDPSTANNALQYFTAGQADKMLKINYGSLFPAAR